MDKGTDYVNTVNGSNCARIGIIQLLLPKETNSARAIQNPVSNLYIRGYVDVPDFVLTVRF